MKRITYIGVLLSIVLFLSSCSPPANTQPISKTEIFFDTVITITLYDSNSAFLFDELFSLCKTYENSFSRTISTSDVSRINAAKGASTTVSDETIALLEYGLYYSELSDGAFDITIAPLSTLWNFKNNTGILPDANRIKEALSHVNYKNVHITGNTVTLLDEGASIDLGGIAKGYIADQLKEYLLKKGVTSALINLGGNIVTLGTKPDGSKYTVGIQKPFDEQNQAITSVEVADSSVVSSGLYERYFEVDKKIYHHILDPSTGYPYNNDLLEVTIISDLSVDGDGLSTTCFALGLTEGMTLINSIKGVKALFITSDYQFHYSKNWDFD